jgi:HAD superfamily phosphatase (TIGR01668 family)
MDNFYPDMYQKSIYTINYKKLKKNGIKCLLFDLNNTLASYDEDYPSEKLREFIYNLGKDFKIIIVSNSNKNRIRPFKEKLNLDSSFSSKKPFNKKLKKIMRLYKLRDIDIALIGDSLLTDIYGGNKMNFTTILVNAISEDEPFHVRMARKFENIIIKKFNKKGLLIKGKYYE